MKDNGKPTKSSDGSPDIHMLIARFHEPVYRYSYRLAGRQTDAEDITQQTFLIAHEKLSQLKSASSAKSWLMTIARNCFLKRIRRKKAVPASNIELDVEQINEPDDDAPAVEAPDPNALKNAIAELDPHHRLVIMMFYFEEMSYRQIATQLNVKIGTVMSRLSRAKTKLREALKRQGIDQEWRTVQ